jgi:flagellar biosynthetic protein FlhB
MSDESDKTEKPTEKHLGEALEEGRFAKTPELSVVFVLVAALLVIGFTAQESAERLAGFWVSSFAGFATTQLRSETVSDLMQQLVVLVAKTVVPMLAASALAAGIAGGLQTGFRLTPKVLGLHFEKLDPRIGLQRIFSKRALVLTGVDALKLVAVAGSLYVGARGLISDPLFTSPVETSYLGRFLYSALTAFLSRIALSLGVVAAISFAYERFRNAQELKMTRQEVKDEHRSSEGDALVKGNRRRLARRLLQKQMLAAVATADVVITNPTHYAVALKYDRATDRAPLVLAKGENRFARRIRELAAEHGVPSVENPPVARTLFALGRVGESIPPELYQAVAQILAFVYRTHRYYFHSLKARRLETTA